MLTTAYPWTIPYSERTDPPDDPTQSKSWADRIATNLTTVNTALSTPTGNVATLQTQMTNLTTDIDRNQIWTTTNTTTWTNTIGSSNRTITIPAGIFTATPAVSCQIVEPTTAVYPLYRTNAASATSVTVSGWLPVSSTGTWTFFLLAVNYSSTMHARAAADPKPRRDPTYGPAVRRQLVCRNPDCPAAGEPVDVWTYAGATFACGSCGHDIAPGD
jgi:hypothetical protein